jgi:hypothetical protein
MSAMTPAQRQFGEGPLSHLAAGVYTLLVTELLVLLTSAPGLAVLMLLDRDASNLPLAALCAVPVGPALSAALYALHHRRLDLTELHPAAAFWRGYRANAVGALKVWVPWLAWVTVIGVNVTHRGAAGVPGWWTVPMLLIGLAATLWLGNALVITSLFRFRLVDVARLAGYFLFRTPGVTLGTGCLLVVAAAVTALASEAVLALAAVLFLAALLRTSRPLIDEVRATFTR